MRFLHRTAEHRREYELRLAPGSDPTVAELSTALRSADTDRPSDDPADGLMIDGQFHAGSTRLSQTDLVEGSTVETATPAPGRGGDSTAEAGTPETGTPETGTLAVIGGVGAGARFALRPGRTVVGASARADATIAGAAVSPFHLALDRRDGGVLVTDLDSHNGTLVDGTWLLEPREVEPDEVIDLGPVHLALRRPVDDAPLGLARILGRTPSGTSPFNRPPRPAPPAPTLPVTVPAAPPPSRQRALFSWASFLAPLVFGLAMAAFTNPLFALFALLSPVMALATWVENRRRHSKESKRASAGLRRALGRLDADLSATRRHEQRRRRLAHPDLAEVCRRAAQPSTRLWERRLDHLDALELVVGVADLDWEPDTETEAGAAPAPEAMERASNAGRLHAVPVVVTARAGEVIGVVGPRAPVLAVARSLVVQAAVHHGPADLAVGVATVAAHGPDWGWASWLPHTRDRRDGGRRRTVAIGLDEIASLVTVDPGTDAGPGEHLRLVVVDGDGLTTGRTSPVRALLASRATPTAGVVVASTLDRLPSMCTTVVEMTDPGGRMRVSHPAPGQVVDDVLASGLDDAQAAATARDLARFDDPELALADAGVPDGVALVELLGMEQVSADEVSRRWRGTRGTAGLRVPVGADGEGVLEIDLVRDGPHGLVGGTTGSGKSELLRSLVASLAATADTDHLNVVLVDYKGGSAFDRCAALPHTVGLVTDLDPHLGARALRCLEAELRHRERLLRSAGADDVAGYRLHEAECPDADPLPRLVVVIDEFATMAAELPDFIDALVGIAQRGRSLGVHLILATQRPSGAVSANIRTNTNLRIALRVLDAGDSTDVIDTRDAASISRNQPGRACARFGPGEVVTFQSALVTGTTPAGPKPSLELIELVDGRPAAIAVPEAAEGPSDLDRLVAAITAAHDELGLAPPRRPWPEPLPRQLRLADLPGTTAASRGEPGVAIGLADEPDRQRQRPVNYDPSEGNAIVVGNPGAGTTTALATIAVAMAGGHPPDAVHLYAIDHGAGGLAPLRALPHCGAVAGAAEPERQARLIRHLTGELTRRRALDGSAVAAEPLVLLLVDNLGGWRSEYEDSRYYELVDQLGRIYADGPAVGMLMVVAADQPGAVPRSMTAATSQVWLMRFADPSDYLAFGVKVGDPGSMPSGRAFRSGTGLEVQLALPHPDGLAAAVETVRAAAPSCSTPPARIGVLPGCVPLDSLDLPARFDRTPAFVPVGIGDDRLATVGFELHGGEHALVAGPARSGKSTALLVMAQLAAAAGARVVAVAGLRSPLAAAGCLDDLAAGVDGLAAALDPSGEATLVLVDDADQLDDPGATLAGLLSEHRPGLHLVAAGRADRLRAAYGHWTSTVRSSRTGVLLNADLLDGDLLGIQLPPRVQLPPLPGRGWLVTNGSPEVCQLATPPPLDL